MTQRLLQTVLFASLMLIALFLFGGCDGDSGGDGFSDPDGDVMSDGDADASSCPDGFYRDSETGACLPGRPCPNGFVWDAASGTCRPENVDSDGDETDGDEGDGDLDESEAEIEAEEDAIVVPPDTFQCSDLGLAVRSFEDVEAATDLYAKAADLTLQTTAGEWNLKDNWTGCETYLFIQQNPRQNQGFGTPLWSRDVDDLLERLPENAQVFFILSTTDSLAIITLLKSLREDVEAAIADEEKAVQDRWYHRIHYVNESVQNLSGWLGTVLKSPGWGVGIDRLQCIRYIGSYADQTRYDAGVGWYAPNLSMAANEAIYYNFEAEREERMAAQTATVLSAFAGEELSDPGWAGTKGYADVVFPNAETMAEMDTMELDLYLGCVGDGEYGDCPAWDYIVHLYLCEVENPDTCNIEIGRWITTYHREGRWVHDVSHFLPLFAAGGTRRLAFYTQQPYEVELSIRLMNQAKESQPSEATHLFSGGAFNADYNSQYEARTLSIPADAVAVKLATVITGHGMASPGNCAEFCNTSHHFGVNDDEIQLDFPQAGTNTGCMDQVGEGTVPNQYGTWWYGRSGWCPGREVAPVLTDITSLVTKGAENVFTYSGFYRDEAYTGSGANIRMESWLVIER